MKLTVNGKPRKLELAPDTSLLFALRDELDLKGTKYGCGAGNCGACTVLVDGRPARACQLSLEEVAGTKVTTIEGLSENGEPDPVQAAFINHQAAQCGFCIPGMVMTVKGMLNVLDEPDPDQVLQALNENRCRCGTHTRIRRAVEDLLS